MIETIIFALLAVAGVISLIASDSTESPGGIIFGVVCVIVSYILLSDITNTKGIEEGAYNQLRGKYEISYIVNDKGCVTDTIINVK
jgi:hypothetical protein